jgi:hypothetical protein
MHKLQDVDSSIYYNIVDDYVTIISRHLTCDELKYKVDDFEFVIGD